MILPDSGKFSSLHNIFRFDFENRSPPKVYPGGYMKGQKETGFGLKG